MQGYLFIISVSQYLLRSAELVLGKNSANELPQISLSNDRVKGRIDEPSQDIKDQILDQVRNSPVLPSIVTKPLTLFGVVSCWHMLVSCQANVQKRNRCPVTPWKVVQQQQLFCMVYQTSFRKTNFHKIRWLGCVLVVLQPCLVLVTWIVLIHGTLNSE